MEEMTQNSDLAEMGVTEQFGEAPKAKTEKKAKVEAPEVVEEAAPVEATE